MVFDWATLIESVETGISNVVSAFATAIQTYAPILIGLSVGVIAVGGLVAFGKDVFKGLNRAITALVPF